MTKSRCRLWVLVCIATVKNEFTEPYTNSYNYEKIFTFSICDFSIYIYG